MPYATPVSKVLARILSSFFNFNVNNRLVFQSSEPYGKALFKYYCLAVPQLLVSTVLLTWITGLLAVKGATLITGVNIVIDGILFVLSFFIQKFWVFRKK